MAESGPLFSPFSSDLNVRYREKRTFRNNLEIFTILTNLERPLSDRNNLEIFTILTNLERPLSARKRPLS
jgi:hypothetical protein